MSYQDSEDIVLSVLKNEGPLKVTPLCEKTGFSKRHMSRLTSSLLFKKKISAKGSARDPLYYAVE